MEIIGQKLADDLTQKLADLIASLEQEHTNDNLTPEEKQEIKGKIERLSEV